MKTYQRAELLVETDWLADNLGDPNLRIFDCTAVPEPNSDQQQRKKYPIKPISGRALYEEKHIPGAGYIDVVDDLTDQSSEIPLMMANLQQVIDTFCGVGINNDSRVVLYSSTNPMWATRVWWVLKAVGFDNAAILNGGFAKWVSERRATSNDPSFYSQGEFSATPCHGVFINKEAVCAALDNDDIVLMHSLSQSVYDGSNDRLIFGRRGRIPGSINIPSGVLYNSETGVYLSQQKLNSVFEDVLSDSTKPIITYCGGGMNATNNAFALTLLGYENVMVYDGSMCEWGNDQLLPIETGLVLSN